MDKNQKSKYNMLVKLLAFLLNTDNAAIYAAFTPMVTLVAKLATDKNDWDDYITAEAAETTGMTTDQINAKHIMVDEWFLIESAAYSWALTNNDQTNAANWEHTAAEIYALGNAQAAAQCDQLLLSIAPHTAALSAYGITSGVIIAADGLITAFEATLGQAKSHEATKSAAGTAIDNLIHNTINPELVTLDADVASILLRNQIDFKNGYAAARVEDSLPTHHTEVTAQFYIDGTTTPIIGAQLKEMVSGKDAITDNVGILHLIKFKGGENLMFEASHPRYVTKQIIKTVVRGKKISITIELVPIP